MQPHSALMLYLPQAVALPQRYPARAANAMGNPPVPPHCVLYGGRVSHALPSWSTRLRGASKAAKKVGNNAVIKTAKAGLGQVRRNTPS